MALNYNKLYAHSCSGPMLSFVSFIFLIAGTETQKYDTKPHAKFNIPGYNESVTMQFNALFQSITLTSISGHYLIAVTHNAKFMEPLNECQF